jgi:CRISPR-associated protein Csm3
MFDTFQNAATLRFTLVPDGPVLVRAQSVGLDPGAAEMEFHRSRKDGRPTVFLAGSGLKGVIRAHAERILRTSEVFACDPTNVQAEEACSKHNPKLPRSPSKYPHKEQCPACFTFGSLRCSGRFTVLDAFPVEGLWDETNRTEVRAQVGIDRKSQGSRTEALYDAEVVVGGGFAVELRGENFALWQLGLILQALEHLDLGLVRIGGGKARGLGAVRVQDLELELRFLCGERGTLTGVVPKPGKPNVWGLSAKDVLPWPPGCVESRQGLFRLVRAEGGAAEGLRGALVERCLGAYLSRKAA